MSGQWAGSDRRITLPPDWPTIRPPILTRDGHRCTWIAGLNDGGPHAYLASRYAGHQRCPSTATDVDHIGDPHDHQPHNLRSLCEWHHNRRSSRQGHDAKARLAALRYRPQRPHPGLRRRP